MCEVLHVVVLVVRSSSCNACQKIVSKHSYSDSSARIGALRASARRAPIPHFRPRTHARFHTSCHVRNSE